MKKKRGKRGFKHHVRRIHDAILVKKPIAILFLIIFFLLLIFVFRGIFENIFFREGGIDNCGDGTFYDTCSLNKPYFCEKGIIIEKASICGCKQGFTKNVDSCFSKYSNDSKEISFDYVINGKREKIDFVAYKGVVDYLYSAPRIIFYEGTERPSRVDFKLKHINEEIQRESLMPLVVEIENKAKNKEDQMRIAVSLVQNIPFELPNKTINIFNNYSVNYSRYPYEVLYDNKGVCGEKSELLAFLLREIGYETVLFYYKNENHEAIGIRCPVRYSFNNTGYCFIETSGPAIISDDEIDYANGITLWSNPEIMLISKGISLGDDLLEYRDAENFKKIRKSLKDGRLTDEERDEYEKLKIRYGLVDVYGL